MAEERIIKVTKKAICDGLVWVGIFLAIAFWRYWETGQVAYFILFGYIGLSIWIGSFLSIALVRKHKPWARRISQMLIGLFMLGLLGFLAHENMQIEGFFFYLFSGVFAGATLHYFIAKLIGPVLFGRAWCGWACWTMMILDLFPWKRPAQGRIPKLGLLRYLHLALVTGSVFALVYLLDYGPEQHASSELTWLIIGNAAYYLLGLGLAIWLKDNRAFCKYICPIPIFQKVLSRFSLSKQQIDMEKCTDCGLCEKNCLMDIKLLSYAKNGQRILSTECILCDTCVQVCPTSAIGSTFKIDGSFTEHLNFRERA